MSDLSDLIKRLRDPLECPDTKSVFKLCDEAADELERLTSELDKRNFSMQRYIEKTNARVEALEGEREELRVHWYNEGKRVGKRAASKQEGET